MNDLKSVRLGKALTMKTVSAQAGITDSYYCLIESGKRRPSVEVAKRIAHVLGLNWTEFFKEEEV